MSAGTPSPELRRRRSLGQDEDRSCALRRFRRSRIAARLDGSPVADLHRSTPVACDAFPFIDCGVAVRDGLCVVPSSGTGAVARAEDAGARRLGAQRRDGQCVA